MIPMEEFLSKEICYSRTRGKELVDLKAKVRKLLSGLGILHPGKTTLMNRRVSLLVLLD
jgi:hypothetical protein